MGHTVFVMPIQFSHYSTRAATDSKEINGRGCVTIRPDFQKQPLGQIQPTGYSPLIQSISAHRVLENTITQILSKT